MAGRWHEALSSINSYVDELRSGTDKAENALVTCAVFDTVAISGTIDFKVVRKRVLPDKWIPLSSADVAPRNATPLYDAVSQTVALAEAGDAKRTVIVIMTDGFENSSRETSREAAMAMLDRCRKRDWQIVFLGADFDATAQAAAIGININNTINGVIPQAMESTMRTASTYSKSYFGTGATMAWSENDRAKARGA